MRWRWPGSLRGENLLQVPGHDAPHRCDGKERTRPSRSAPDSTPPLPNYIQAGSGLPSPATPPSTGRKVGEVSCVTVVSTRQPVDALGDLPFLRRFVGQWGSVGDSRSGDIGMGSASASNWRDRRGGCCGDAGPEAGSGSRSGDASGEAWGEASGVGLGEPRCFRLGEARRFPWADARGACPRGARWRRLGGDWGMCLGDAAGELWGESWAVCRVEGSEGPPLGVKISKGGRGSGRGSRCCWGVLLLVAASSWHSLGAMERANDEQGESVKIYQRAGLGFWEWCTLLVPRDCAWKTAEGRVQHCATLIVLHPGTTQGSSRCHCYPMPAHLDFLLLSSACS